MSSIISKDTLKRMYDEEYTGKKGLLGFGNYSKIMNDEDVQGLIEELNKCNKFPGSTQRLSEEDVCRAVTRLLNQFGEEELKEIAQEPYGVAIPSMVNLQGISFKDKSKTDSFAIYLFLNGIRDIDEILRVYGNDIAGTIVQGRDYKAILRSLTSPEEYVSVPQEECDMFTKAVQNFFETVTISEMRTKEKIVKDEIRTDYLSFLPPFVLRSDRYTFCANKEHFDKVLERFNEDTIPTILSYDAYLRIIEELGPEEKGLDDAREVFGAIKAAIGEKDYSKLKSLVEEVEANHNGIPFGKIVDDCVETIKIKNAEDIIVRASSFSRLLTSEITNSDKPDDGVIKAKVATSIEEFGTPLIIDCNNDIDLTDEAVADRIIARLIDRKLNDSLTPEQKLINGQELERVITDIYSLLYSTKQESLVKPEDIRDVETPVFAGIKRIISESEFLTPEDYDDCIGMIADINPISETLRITSDKVIDFFREKTDGFTKHFGYSQDSKEMDFYDERVARLVNRSPFVNATMAKCTTSDVYLDDILESQPSSPFKVALVYDTNTKKGVEKFSQAVTFSKAGEDSRVVDNLKDKLEALPDISQSCATYKQLAVQNPSVSDTKVGFDLREAKPTFAVFVIDEIEAGQEQDYEWADMKKVYDAAKANNLRFAVVVKGPIKRECLRVTEQFVAQELGLNDDSMVKDSREPIVLPKK